VESATVRAIAMPVRRLRRARVEQQARCLADGALAGLGRLYKAARAVPDRRLPAVLVAAVGHTEGLGGPEVAVGPERGGFALVAAHHRVDVLAPYAIDVADFTAESAPLLIQLRIVWEVSWNSNATCSTVSIGWSVMTDSFTHRVQAAMRRACM
jgi:hypothetical protein